MGFFCEGEMKRLSVLACVAVLASAGCGLSDPSVRGEDPEMAAIRKEYTAPKGWKLAVDPVEMSVGTEPGGKEWVLKLDPGQIQSGVVEALRETRIFQETAPAGTGQDGADLRLKLKVTGAIGKFEGTNGNEILQLLVWWGFSSLLGCMVADEDYSAWMQVEASVHDASSGDTVWSGSVKPAFSASLDHYQKGIDLWDLIPPGTIISSHDPDKVTEKLLPHLLRKLEVDLVRKLAAEVPPPPVDVVVVLGADVSSGGFKTESASADAKKFANAFCRNRQRAEAVELTGGTGDAGALKKAMADLAARKEIRIRDFIFYFAGCGSVVKSPSGSAVPALVLAAGASGVSVITLADLLESVKPVAAESKGVVLDASFESGKGRFLKSAGDAGAVEFPTVAGFGLLHVGGASESRETGGALTSFLTGDDAFAADADNNGKVMLGEIVKALGFSISRAVRRTGGSGSLNLAGDAVLFRVQPKSAPDKPADESSEEPGAKEGEGGGEDESPGSSGEGK